MRIHRFIGNFDFSKATLRISDSASCNQIRNVLRMKTGDQLLLADGQAHEARCTITTLASDYVEVRIDEQKLNAVESNIAVTLYCSILKHDNFELVVQKATEIGVARIVPVISERTVKLAVREERLQTIMKEASEQSGRSVVPALDAPISFEEAIEALENPADAWFLHLEGDRLDLKKANPEDTNGEGSQSRAVFIGPEGGWNKEELTLAREKGLKIISLGALVLRAETAAIVASYLAVQN